jgi:hypothetical protein
MLPLQKPFIRSGGLLGLLVAALALTLSCSAPQPRPTGVAYEFDSAKDMFKRGRFDRVAEFADGPATASPANAFTERALLLEVALYSGQIKAYKELVDAYQKGADTTKNSRFKVEFQRRRNDYLQVSSRLALALGDAAHRLTEGSLIAKEITFEAPYPTTEGPLTLPPLERVMEGGWIEPDEQEAVAREAQAKGIDDALAEMVGGDRSKARSELTAGPVKLAGVDFSIYLGKALLEGASLFDRKHMRDSMKLRTLCGVADEAAQAALALLKENPDREKERAVKKLQSDVKKALKNL